MRWEVACFVVLIMLASASLVVGGAEVGFVEVSAWLWILLTSMRRLVEEGFEAGLVVDVRVLLGRGGSVARRWLRECLMALMLWTTARMV